MIRSFELVVAEDGSVVLPPEALNVLRIEQRRNVTLLLAQGVAHILPAPMTLAEVRDSLPALDHETDEEDTDVLIDAIELTLREKAG